MRFKALKVLNENNADVNFRQESGFTPLARAPTYGKYRIVELLI